MSSKLEQFIKEHRSEFNDEHPSKNVWDEIEATLPREKKGKVVSLMNVYKLMAAAAVVFIVITSTYFLYFKDNATKGSDAVQTNDQMKEVAPEYATQLNQEFKVIQTRQQELKTATASKPELYQAFQSDLKVLDSTYQMLQKQALSSPNRDVIIKAMLNNLKLQSELLFRQLIISTELNQKQEPSNQNQNAELNG